MATTTDEPTLGQLVASASRDLSALVRNEIELAKTELRDDAKAAARGSAMFAVAAFLGVLVLILLSIAAAYGLTAAGLHPAIAFLIVAGAYLLIALILALVGKRQVGRIGPPERAIATAKETAAALKRNSSMPAAIAAPLTAAPSTADGAKPLPGARRGDATAT